jgi:hypothetical protein
MARSIKLKDVLSQFRPELESEKNASETEVSPADVARTELEETLGSVLQRTGHVKTAGEYGEDTLSSLTKMASAAVDRNQEVLSQDLNFCGRLVGEGIIEKLAEAGVVFDSDELDDMDKEASEDDYAMSWQEGYSNGVKVAEDLFGGSEEDELEDGFKLAEEEEFYAGAEEGYKYAAEEFEAQGGELDGWDGDEEGSEKTSEEEEAEFEDGVEEGYKYAAEEFEAQGGELDGWDGDEEGSEKTSEEEEEEFEDGAEEGYKYASDEFEKYSEETSFLRGYNDGIEWIEKTAEDLGSYDFLYDLDLEDFS